MEQDEIKKALSRIAETVEENNRIIKKLHNAALWARFFRILYWVVIILIAMGAYYYIQPYIEKMGLTWTVLKENIENIQKISGSIPNM